MEVVATRAVTVEAFKALPNGPSDLTLGVVSSTDHSLLLHF